MRVHTTILTVVALAVGGFAVTAQANDACLDFKWDVSKERALFAGKPAALTAGKDLQSAPVVVPNRLYELRLVAQAHVTFRVPPAAKMPGSTAYGGVATLKIEMPGSYRIAVDLPLWIDVVSNGTLVAAEDFQGQKDCSAPHKIVTFNLAGVQQFVLQLSNATNETVLLTVIPSPSRKL